MKKALSVTISIIISLSMLAIITLTCLQYVAFNGTDWYRKEYTKYDVLEDVHKPYTMDEILGITAEMQDYMMVEKDSLPDFFTEREKLHLKDCRDIIAFLKKLRPVLIAVVIVLGAAYIYLSRKDPRRSAKRFTITYAATVVAVGVLTLLLVLSGGFEDVFIGFHHMVFDNDLWLLDQAEADLINLLPLGFFSDTVQKTALLIVAAEAVIIAILAFVTSKLPRT